MEKAQHFKRLNEHREVFRMCYTFLTEVEHINVQTMIYSILSANKLNKTELLSMSNEDFIKCIRLAIQKESHQNY